MVVVVVNVGEAIEERRSVIYTHVTLRLFGPRVNYSRYAALLIVCLLDLGGCTLRINTARHSSPASSISATTTHTTPATFSTTTTHQHTQCLARFLESQSLARPPPATPPSPSPARPRPACSSLSVVSIVSSRRATTPSVSVPAHLVSPFFKISRFVEY